MKEQLYRLARHIAAAKGGLPADWQDWAEEIESDLRRLSSQSAPVAVPDGWQLVPKVPTQEMCNAVLGRACFSRDGDGARYIFNAMIKHAPAAPLPAPVFSDAEPSLNAMMRALDAFYADDDVPERAMLAAFKILLADVRGQVQEPATDNTAQQFEALATSAPATPTFTAEELKSFGREMWFDGWRTSPHTPNPNYDCNQAFIGTDVAERLTTSAGSGKQ